MFTVESKTGAQDYSSSSDAHGAFLALAEAGTEVYLYLYDSLLGYFSHETQFLGRVGQSIKKEAFQSYLV
jgi:hypothetical protein